MNSRKNRVIVCVFLLGLGFVLSPWHHKMENRSSLMWLFEARGPLEAPKDVAVAAINSQSSETLGLERLSVQWSRQRYAELIRQLAARGARLIVLDIAFKKSRPSEDQILAEALRDAGNVLLFQYVERHTREVDGMGILDIQQPIAIPTILQDASLASANFTLPLSSGRVVATELYRDFGDGPSASLPLVAYLLTEQEAVEQLFDEWLSFLGQSTAFPFQANDKRSFVTKVDLLRRSVDKLPSAAQQWPQTWQEGGKYSTTLRTRLLNSFTRPSQLLINYYGPNSTIETVPMDVLLKANVDVDATSLDLRNKIVFVGLSESVQTAQRDNHKTVYSQANGVDLSGVEILATIFANLYHDQVIRPAGDVLNLIIVFVILLCAAVCLRFLAFGPAICLQLFLYGIFVFAAFSLFKHSIYVPILTPFLLLCVLNIAVLITEYYEGRENSRQAIKGMSRYVPEHIARSMTEFTEQPENQHQVVSGVCLLSDLQGYSRLSEILPPDDLHRLLNRYYEVLAQTISAHGGHIANIVGDSLLAIWTSNAFEQRDCLKAVAAAQSIRESLHESSDLRELLACTSIGVNGGEFSLGNLGSGQHFEYSPVGDTVNTTARIEKLNRVLGTHILVSEAVASCLNEKALFYVGIFTLHNKAQKVRLYSPLNTLFLAEDKLELSHQLEVAIRKYEGGKNEEAYSLFTAWQLKYGHQPLVEYYLNQLASFHSKPLANQG